jgi:hypothetical protein
MACDERAVPIASAMPQMGHGLPSPPCWYRDRSSPYKPTTSLHCLRFGSAGQMQQRTKAPIELSAQVQAGA